MKILYINRPKSDYLQDMLYTGLVKTLGVSNVIDMPWNNKFHLNFKKYPKNIGYCKKSLFKSLLAKLSAKNFSMVIVASCHPDTLKVYLDLITKIPLSVKTVFVDGGDWPEVAGDLKRVGGEELYGKIQSVRPFDYVFKREYLIDKEYEKNVYPLPFAFNFDRLPLIRKEYKYDVSFWAVESDPVRTSALNMLEDQFDCKSNGTVRNQVMKKYKRKGDFYLQELADCKITLNFRGAGWDTLRYWEVPALGGFMVTQKPGIVINNNFVHGKEVIYCSDDLSDLLELCEYYLENDNKRESIGRRALEKIHDFHTDTHRAKEVLTIAGY
ncbi:MAG: hypothetical protein BMS9Abin31_0121 [Gammaproteobacteria bacterium]|nr:MAG: hypothetical protein BMS9Abin31_0121 [Gammaproteobacteria bacterium]